MNIDELRSPIDIDRVIHDSIQWDELIGDVNTSEDEATCDLSLIERLNTSETGVHALPIF